MPILVLLLIVLLPALSEAASVTLTWNANTESDLAGYKVYRGTPCGNPQALPGPIATLDKVTTYVDSSAPDGVDVEYEITAYDTSGNESVRSNRACKMYVITYYKTVTDAKGDLWGLVGTGPKYRVYLNGQDLLPGVEKNNASDVRLVDGVAQFQGTDGDTAWYVYVDGKGWQPVDQTPPAAPTGLKAE